MRVKIVAIQQPLHEPLTADQLEQLKQFSPYFVCLPEHYPLAKHIQNIEEAASVYLDRKQYLQKLSQQIPAVLIGGTLTERTAEGFYNTCYLFEQGKELGYYRKVYPTSREQEVGVLKGTEFKVFNIHGIRIGILICADVLFEKSFEEMSALDCQLVFVPTASPYRKGESAKEKFERDRSIFVEGARKLGCPVVKTCGVGTTFGHPIQGRSLIALPEKILVRAEPDQEHAALMLKAELDLK
jgi:omega-amidase